MIKRVIIIIMILMLTSCNVVEKNENHEDLLMKDCSSVDDYISTQVEEGEGVYNESINNYDGVFTAYLATLPDRDKRVESVYNYLSGEWILQEYINLVWYPTGEDDDSELRSAYEVFYKDYLGMSIEFSEENLTIPNYLNGLSIYE